MVFCEMTGGLRFVSGVARIEASAVEAGRAAVALLADVAGQVDVPARQVLIAPQVISGWSAGRPGNE